jgi:hypothetical protein
MAVAYRDRKGKCYAVLRETGKVDLVPVLVDESTIIQPGDAAQYGM